MNITKLVNIITWNWTIFGTKVLSSYGVLYVHKENYYETVITTFIFATTNIIRFERGQQIIPTRCLHTTSCVSSTMSFEMKQWTIVLQNTLTEGLYTVEYISLWNKYSHE